MVVYFSVLIAVHLLSYVAQNNRSRVLSHVNKSSKMAWDLALCILIMVAGLRYRVGTDYAQYFASFESYAINVGSAIRGFNEPGINILAFISATLVHNAFGMFFLASFLTIALVGRTIYKYSYDLNFSALIFLFAGCWTGSFNGIRQYLAAAVIFAGHRYIYEKKLWKYCLTIIVAMVFHKSAIVMLPMYFIPTKKVDFKSSVYLVAIGVAFAAFSSRLIDNVSIVLTKYQGVDMNTYAYVTSTVKWQRILVAIVPVAVALFVYGKDFLNNYEEVPFYFNLMLLNAAITAGTSVSVYLARVAIYTNIFLVLSYPNVFLIRDRNDRFLRGIILFFYFIFWIYEISTTYDLYNWNWIFSVV